MSGAAVEPTSSRSAWVDCAKGLGTLLVVFGHVWRGIHAAGLPMDAALFGYVDALVYSFHMPLFFLLSGLFIERAATKPAVGVVTSKLRSIAYPYVVWTVLYGTANVVLSPFTNTHVSFSDIFPSFIYAPYAHFWFLYALFGCAMLYLVLAKLGLRTGFIAALGLLFYATTPLFGLGVWGVPYLVRSHFFYFALGAWLNHRAFGTFRASRQAWLMGGLALALVSAAAVAVTQVAAVLAVPCLALIGTASVIAWSRWLEATGCGRWLARLGALSLPVYVAHTLGTAAARIVLVKVGHVDSLSMHVAAGMIGGLMFPLALYAAAERARFPYLFTLNAREATSAPPALPTAVKAA